MIKTHCLRDFCSSENLFFWIEVEQWKELLGTATEDPNAARIRAEEIYNIYLTEESPYRIVGLGSQAEVLKEIRRKIRVPEPLQSSLFQSVQEHIQQWMEHDSFPKFKTTDAYKTWFGMTIM